MRDTIASLFSSGVAEPIPDEPNVFGIAAQVVLRSGYGTAGVLTVEDDGILRMVQPGLAKNPVAQTAPPIPIMANHYFWFTDVETIVIVSMPKKQPEKSRIVMEG